MTELDKLFEILKKHPYTQLQQKLLHNYGCIYVISHPSGHITFPDGAEESIKSAGWTTEEFINHSKGIV